jgi:hypothetical protein
MKRAFAMFVALFVLVLVSTILAWSVSLSAQSSVNTTKVYLKEQAKLLLFSSTEFTLLALSGHDHNSEGCLEQINMTYPENNPFFDVNISISYIGQGLPCNADAILDNSLVTAESNLTVMLDTVVTSNDTLGLSEPIRLHRRTLQKP